MPPIYWFFFVKIAISAVVIASASSLANRQPALAGYITALPLISILALSLNLAQSGSGEETARYATSIFAALPVSALFFVPFLFYPRLKGNLWLYLAVGISLLYAGSYLHRLIVSKLVA